MGGQNYQVSRLTMADKEQPKLNEDYERLRSGVDAVHVSEPQDDEKDNKEDDNNKQLDDTVSALEAAECKLQGNELYKSGDYTAAVDKYARAASSSHATANERATYNANLAAAYLALKDDKGVESAATACLTIDADYRKARERRLIARERLSRWRDALEDARHLSLPPSKICALEQRARDADEKAASEAMESLKGLGNSLLSNFGLSLDDFQTQKDPSGSYSISMKKR